MLITNKIEKEINNFFDKLCTNIIFREWALRGFTNDISFELLDFFDEVGYEYDYDYDCCAWGVDKFVFIFDNYVVKLGFENLTGCLEREAENYKEIPDEIKHLFAETIYLGTYYNSSYEKNIEFPLWIADKYEVNEDNYDSKVYESFLDYQHRTGALNTNEYDSLLNYGSSAKLEESLEEKIDEIEDFLYNDCDTFDRTLILFDGYYSKELCDILFDFIQKKEIHDLHGCNIGFDENGLPKIIDYSD